jgi:hypothetical protein
VGCGDASDTGETKAAVISKQKGSGNDQIAFDFFRGKGLTANQAAGIVGNLDQESGMDPAISQPGGPGRGIAQWSTGGRWDSGSLNCTAFAKQEGRDVHSLDLQLDFIWEELTKVPSFGLAQLRQTSTVEEAVTVFQNKYEICGKCAQGNREKFAQEALDAFGKDAPSAATPTAPTAPSAPDTPDTGDTPDDSTPFTTPTSPTNPRGPVGPTIPTAPAPLRDNGVGDGGGCSSLVGPGVPNGVCIQMFGIWLQCQGGQWVMDTSFGGACAGGSSSQPSF